MEKFLYGGRLDIEFPDEQLNNLHNKMMSSLKLVDCPIRNQLTG